MPAAIPIVIGIAAGAGAAAVGVTLGTAIVIGSVVATAASMLSQPKQGVAPPNIPTTYTTDPTQITISTDAARRLLYGKARVSGVMIYSNVSGEDNQYLWMVVALASHKISGVDGIWIDGEPADKYGSKLQWWYMDGDDDQEAHPELMTAFSQWTVSHRLRGIAYAIVKMTHDKEVWKNGPPRNLQFDVRGKPVLDPRTGETEWSRNPAINLYDYLQSDYGLSADVSEFSIEHVKKAADICDEKPPTMASSVCDGRYTANGVIELSTDKATIIDMFTTAMAGAMVWSEGVYYIYAGAHIEPVAEITEDQLADVPQITPQTATDQTFNTVKGTFLDASNGWTFSDFPPVKSEQDIIDDGEPLIRDIQLPLTCSWITAQRLATIFLRRERLEETITLKCDWSAYNLAVWDVIELTLPTVGYNKRQYQIARWDFRFPTTSDPGGVTLLLREYSKDIYSDDIEFIPETGGGVIAKPDTSKISPPKGLNVLSDETTLDPSELTPRLKISWTEHASPYCVGYEVRAFKNGVVALNWHRLPGRNTTEHFLFAEANKSYVVELRAVNSFDRVSEAETSQPVVAKGNPGIKPDDVQRLIVQPAPSPDENRFVVLEWTPVNTAVSYLVGFEDDKGNMSTLESTQNLRHIAPRQSVDGSYLVWAVNSQGNKSWNPAKVYVDGIVIVSEVSLTSINDIQLTTGLVPHLNRNLVPDSRSIASDLGDRLFDEVVPDPVMACEFWSKAVSNQEGNYTPGGAIFLREISGNLAPVKVAGRFLKNSQPIIFHGVTPIEENASLRVGATYLPQTTLAIITGADAYIVRN